MKNKYKHITVFFLILIGLLTYTSSNLTPRTEDSTIYLSTSVPNVSSLDLQIFSSEERNFLLKESRVFSVGIAEDYIPIEYLTPNNEPRGIGIEIFRKVTEKTGIRFKLYRSKTDRSWFTLLEDFKQKKVDLLPTLSYTENRSKFLSYSKPYLQTTLVLIGHVKDNSFSTPPNYNNDKTYVIPKGYWTENIILDENPNANIIYVANMHEAIKFIDQKKADYTICEIPVFSYFKDRGYFNNIKIVGELEEKNLIMIGAQKELFLLLSIINKVILNVNRDEILEKSLYIPKHNDTYYRLIIIITVLGLVLVILAIHLYKTFKAFIKEKKKVELAYKEKTDLIANISHDLRTPMTSILGYANAIIDKEVVDTANINKFLLKIINKTEYLNALIEDIFSLSKLDNSNVNYNYVNTCVSQYLAECYEGLKINPKLNNIDFNLSIEVSDTVTINIDNLKMYEVLDNLLNNAIKSINDNGVITLGAKLYNNKVVIYVSDNGCGIKKDVLPHIFDRYYKGEYAKKNYYSTGLGLSICKNIVINNGGYIDVKSTVLEGSVFYIVFDNQERL